MSEYDKGWNDAINAIIDCLHKAANQVKKETTDTLESREGKKFDAIIKSGNPTYSHRLEDLANAISMMARKV